MIHRNDDGTFVAASRGVWLPGVYDSKQAARYAFRFPNEVLQSLSGLVPISLEDLKAKRAGR